MKNKQHYRAKSLALATFHTTSKNPTILTGCGRASKNKRFRINIQTGIDQFSRNFFHHKSEFGGPWEGWWVALKGESSLGRRLGETPLWL